MSGDFGHEAYVIKMGGKKGYNCYVDRLVGRRAVRDHIRQMGLVVRGQ